jgi:hypothetical protein
LRTDLDHQATDQARIDMFIERDGLAQPLLQRIGETCQLFRAERGGGGDIGGCFATGLGGEFAER